MSATHYWCRLWYPVAPGEHPCDSFLEAGAYTRHAGADGREVEFPLEEPTFISCDVHEAEEIDEIAADEFERRVTSAHELAVARGYAIPAPEPWDGDDRFDGREVPRARSGVCNAVLRHQALPEHCGYAVVELECDTPRGPRRKAVCRQLLSTARSDRTWRDEDLRSLRAAGHVNLSLPYLPSNH